MAPEYLEDAEIRYPDLFKTLSSVDVLVVINSQDRVDSEMLERLEEEIKRFIQDIDSVRGDNVMVYNNVPRPKGTTQGTRHS